MSKIRLTLAILGYGASMLLVLLTGVWFFSPGQVLFSGNIPLTTGHEFPPTHAAACGFLFFLATCTSLTTFGVTWLLQSKSRLEQFGYPLLLLAGCFVISLTSVVLTQIVTGVTYSDATGVPLTWCYFWFFIMIWSVIRKRSVVLAVVATTLSATSGLVFCIAYDKKMHRWDSGAPGMLIKSTQ